MIPSPDGKEFLFLIRVSYEEFEQGVYVLSIEDQELTRVYDEGRAVAWSPDGEEIVVGSSLSQQVVILGPDRELRWTGDVEGFPVEVAWSPDGVYLAVGTAPSKAQYGATTLHLVTIETGEIVTILEDMDNGNLDWMPGGDLLLFETTVASSGGENQSSTNLWVYDATSGERAQVTSGEGYCGMGTWSP